ncbi:MAG: tetratricopeptide repeat protein [Caldilineaceae bacterium]
MASKPKNTPATEQNQPNSFALQVKQALEHFGDAEWLGLHSPLAAPYILGHRLDQLPTGETARERGVALQSALRTAAAQLDDALLQQVLQHGFFERNWKLNLESVALQLDMAPRTFFRQVAKALDGLADLLSRTLLPTLRPEALVYKPLIGRAEPLQACLHALRTRQSVSLLGASGTGKTTLAAALALHWEIAGSTPTASPVPLPVMSLHRSPSTPVDEQPLSCPHVFLFTLRPGLNDQFASFVFALSYFLRVHGAPNTWRQLIADKGVIQPERILSLLRYDFAQTQAAPLLLCIDEVDTLQSELPEHAQIIHLLEELRTLAPLLLIGERMLIKTDLHYTLTGFTLAETQALLRQAALAELAPATLHQLLAATRGNPALLTLVLALVQSGDGWEDVLYDLNRVPSLAALFNRMWRRLSAAERRLLWQLAVFRNAAPLDAWHEQQPLLEQLRQRELVEWDERGGVRLPAHLQPFVAARIPADHRPALHLHAARIRETRGEYVAALHHYCGARQPALAVWLWYSHRTMEIARGQGAGALAVLARIEARELPEPDDRNILHEARAQLLQLAGQVEAAQAELRAVTASGSALLQAQVLNRQGELDEMQGQIEQALAHYRASLATFLGASQHHEVTLHTKLSFLQMYRLHNGAQARKEALLARIKAEAFHGQVEEMSGNYALARQLYESALQLAEQTQSDPTTLSRVYTYLSALTLKQGEIDTAILLAEKAMDCDRRRGDVISPLYDLMNVAYAHILAGRYAEAYKQASQGLYMAEKMQHSYLISGLAATVGEACFYLNRFAEAEQYAHQALNAEEEFFRAAALTLLGLVRQAQGQAQAAVKLIEEALASAQSLEDKYTEAYAWRALGRVQQANAQTEAAQHAYTQARQLYHQLGLQKECTDLDKMLVALAG